MRSKLIIFLLFMVGCQRRTVMNNGVKDHNSSSANVLSNKCDTSYFTSIESANKYPDCVLELSLREKGLTKFPLDVLKYSKLRVLDLSFNKIDSIPKEICSLKQLQVLILSYGALSNIDSSIGGLKSLENLALLYNNISSVPDEICLLNKLRVLNLSGNRIDSLPKCICKMQHLRVLGLSYFEGEKHVDSLQYSLLRSCLPNTAIILHKID